MQSQSYRFALLATSVLPIHYLLSFYSVVFMVAVTFLYFSFRKIVFISIVCLFYLVVCIVLFRCFLFSLLRNESIQLSVQLIRIVVCWFFSLFDARCVVAVVRWVIKKLHFAIKWFISMIMHTNCIHLFSISFGSVYLAYGLLLILLSFQTRFVFCMLYTINVCIFNSLQIGFTILFHRTAFCCLFFQF